MKICKLILICVAVLTVSSTFGQKLKVESGKINALEGVKKLKIEYDYSDLSVGKFDIEEDYIAENVMERNEDEEGKGDKWKENWFNDRPNRYEPKFQELFSDYAEFIESGKEIESDIVMNVHTTFIELGYNVGVMRRPALINLTITFSKDENEIVVISILKSPGADALGYDFDTAHRISEAYAKAGKTLGKYLSKQLD